MSGGSDVGSRVTDVGKLAGRVTARGDIPAEDLLLGMDENGRVVVRIKQLVQCARNVGEHAASRAMKEQGAAAELAHLLGHGGSLNTASWGHHKHPVCDVQHVSKVLEWAAGRPNNIVVLCPQQRQELVQDVQKASCDLAATKLTRSRDAMADSIGVEIAGVDAEVNRLGAGLESAKEDLQRTRTELAVVQAEADRVSHALTGVKLDLEREGRTCKTLEADVKDLRVQLLAAQEAQRVPEEVSRFVATTAEVQLVEEDETMTWRAQIRTDSGRTQSLHADTLSSRTRGADAPARDEGAPAKRPREGDSAAEVDARRSFVALYVPSVVGTEWTELVLPGGSSVVPAAVFNCQAKTACDEQLRALHKRHATAGSTVTAAEERDIVTRIVLTDGARRRRSFEEACAAVAATVTSVSAAALGVGEESEDENEMVPEEQPLGTMRSEGATDLGD